MRLKKVFFYLVSLFLTLISCVLILEGGLRAFYGLKNKYRKPSSFIDASLGRHPAPFYSRVAFYPGYGEVSYSSQKYGFRIFGDPNTDKIKIFVIGDSFTQAEMISDRKVYYDYLSRMDSNIELFVFGSSGYGTLQEYMILDRYFDVINPDLILWQFCSNDLINNSFKLESASFFHNNGTARPYYDPKSGNVEVLFPRLNYGWLYKLIKASYFYKSLELIFDRQRAAAIGSIEQRLTRDSPLFTEALGITGAIMAKVKRRVDTTPVITFAAITEEFPAVNDQTFSEIARSLGMQYIDGINARLADAKKHGVSIDGFEGGGDEHWNEYSHAVAGRMIYDYLRKNNHLKKKDRKERPRL